MVSIEKCTNLDTVTDTCMIECVVGKETHVSSVHSVSIQHLVGARDDVTLDAM